MNDRRAVIVGLCDTSPTFNTYPVLYSKYSDAVRYSEVQSRKVMPFILVKASDPTQIAAVARRIAAATKLTALTQADFADKTIWYYMIWTGIPVNFAITVVLGFIVGAVIVGQTLFIFVNENLRQFGALKAMGVENVVIVRMILLQGTVVAAIGYGLGTGMTGLFFYAASDLTDVLRGFRMTWTVVVGSGFAVAGIVVISSLTSIRKVTRLDPTLVFRG